ncbi:MAG: hypothetical protein GY928_18680 [Colwellia sp.]|nr:hypothetical protein [Colwellia sp.]
MSKEPIGKFILDNAQGKQMADGAYYHYATVCSLLKAYADQQKQELVKDILDDMVGVHPEYYYEVVKEHLKIEDNE